MAKKIQTPAPLDGSHQKEGYASYVGLVVSSRDIGEIGSVGEDFVVLRGIYIPKKGDPWIKFYSPPPLQICPGQQCHTWHGIIIRVRVVVELGESNLEGLTLDIPVPHSKVAEQYLGGVGGPGGADDKVLKE